jgi:hypothetical protein
MNFKLKVPSILQEAPQTPVVAGGETTPAAPAVATVERSVYCSHGIHNGHFPVAGLTVAEARRTLNHLLNIDPDAVAVIAGQIIADENQIISVDTAMLSFVKKSSVKGSGGGDHACA